MFGVPEKVRVGAAAAALVLALSVPVHVARADLQPGPAAAQNNAFDDATLRAFAAAAIEVEALRADYIPRIRVAASAESRERAEALFVEMRTRMHAAIRAGGLDPVTYDAIASAARSDPALRGRIDRFMEGGSTMRDAAVPAQGQRPAAASPVAAADDGSARRAQRELEAARALLVDLRGQLEAERARTRLVRTELAETRARHAARLLDVAQERSRGLAALQRAESERMVLSREIGWHARRLQTVGTALAALAGDLAAPATTETEAPAEARSADLRPLEPIAAMRFESARRIAVLPPAPSDVGLRDELAALRARAAVTAARNDAQRHAAARELARLADDLATGVTALEQLAGSVALAPAPTEDGAHEPSPVEWEVPVVADPKPAPAAPVGASGADAATIVDSPEQVPVPAPDETTTSERDPAPVSPGGVMDGIAAYMDGDYARAYAIWMPLAGQGVARAQFHLGALHFEGRGTPRDLDAAGLWLARALDGGHAAAARLLEQIERERTGGGRLELAQRDAVPRPKPLR